MRAFELAITAAMSILFASAASAQEKSSVYTELDAQKDCVVFSAPPEGEPGDWSNLVCSGYKGYPIFIYYSGARESLFYGFPPAGDLAPQWESFASFNRTGPTVEWRVMHEGEREVPFATIHRWFVSDGTEREIEVLVLEKVGQPGVRAGCSVGYVVATGNENANEQARRIADREVLDFNCSAGEPLVETGRIPAPRITR